MDAATLLVCSNVTAFSPTFSSSRCLFSYRHFNKRVECRNAPARNSVTQNNLKLVKASSNCCLSVVSNCEDLFRLQTVFPSLSTSNSRTICPFRSFKCLYSSSPAPSESDSQNPLLKSLKDFSFEPLKSALLQLTPVRIFKWCLIFSVAIAVSKWTVNLLFNPFVWTYFSWTWLFWPWMVATGLGVYGVHSLNKYLKGEANVVEQLAIVTSAVTWLTLVPPAHFNGFLEGWPFVFFFVYHYFFFLHVSVRKRLYGDYYPREHDPKWDISLPSWQKIFFCVGVMVAHWLAALEGPELHLIPGGWNSVVIWVLIILTVYMQYHSTLYLAKYSEKVAVPTAVVQFGPYRLVRHPIYASTMLLFVTYFVALRAPISALVIIAICLMYYRQKAKLEEALMLENFGEMYREYMSKVPYKLIPLVF